MSSGHTSLPAAAAWRHQGARDGFEVVFAHAEPGGYRFDGHTTAVEGGEAWSVGYSVVVDERWSTRSAHVVARSVAGLREVTLAADGDGAWLVDGEPAPELAGCLDVDLESCVVTNALPVRRLRLRVGEASDAPAAFVRAPGLTVERLEQRYRRLPDDPTGDARYAYAAPRFGYTGELRYEAVGLLLDYPGLATRIR
jgi:hypothetical protein